MNLDELTINIRRVSKEDVVQKLAEHIQLWKNDERNAVELRENVERFLGNIWIDKRADFDKIYIMWTGFKTTAIDGIGGMTINERLYWFGLFDLFDNAKNDAERDKFYRKLMAAR
tara:strand:- start:4322 stop:4666 length:345 start_codon:yes stop_codon:yes gene_type:complete